LRYCPFNRNRIYNHPGTPTPNHTDNPNHFHIYLYVLINFPIIISVSHAHTNDYIFTIPHIPDNTSDPIPMLICTYTNNHTRIPAQTHIIHNHNNMSSYPTQLLFQFILIFTLIIIRILTIIGLFLLVVFSFIHTNNPTPTHTNNRSQNNIST
jgi:hypothetical protein